MNASGVERLFLILLLSLAGSASAKDLSTYPCTVFSGNACFRSPAGTHVNYSVPADFDLYRVSKGSETVATIYIGNAPQPVESLVSPSVNQLETGSIKIYRDKEGPVESLDIYIMPKAMGASTVHISAVLNSSTHQELVELLSSFRPCKPIKAGGQKCPQDDSWSKELTKELVPLTGRRQALVEGQFIC